MGVGNIKLISNVEDCITKKVFYVPDIRSVKKIEMSNIKVIFENSKVTLKKQICMW